MPLCRGGLILSQGWRAHVGHNEVSLLESVRPVNPMPINSHKKFAPSLKISFSPLVREPGRSIGTNFGSKAHSDF